MSTSVPLCPRCGGRLRPSRRLNRDFECSECGRCFNAVPAGPDVRFRLSQPQPTLVQILFSLAPIPVLGILPLVAIFGLNSRDGSFEHVLMSAGCFGSPVAALLAPVVTFAVLRALGRPARVVYLVLSIIINGVVLALLAWLTGKMVT